MQRSRLVLFFLVVLGSFLVTVSSRAGDDVGSERLAVIDTMYGEYRHDFPGIGEVSADTLMAWVKTGGAVIVDIRERAEREISMLPHSITRKELDAYLEDPDDRRIVIYCTIGYRSGLLTRSLQKKGVEAYNLEGGILAWVHRGGMVEQDGEPSHRVHVYGKRWNLLPEAYEPIW